MYKISIIGRVKINAIQKTVTCGNYLIFRRHFMNLNFKNFFGGSWFRRQCPNVLISSENAVAECGNKLTNLIKIDNIDKNIEEFFNYTSNICILSSNHENILIKNKSALLDILNDNINKISNNSLVIVTKIFNSEFTSRNDVIIREWMKRLSQPDQITQFTPDILIDCLSFLLNNQIFPLSKEIKDIVKCLDHQTNNFSARELAHFYHSLPNNTTNYDKIRQDLYERYIRYIDTHHLTRDEVMAIVNMDNISNDFLHALYKPILNHLNYYSLSECVDILCQYTKINLYIRELMDPFTRHIMSNLQFLDNNFDRFVLLLPKLANYNTTINHQYLLDLYMKKTNRSNEMDIGRAISVLSTFDIGDSIFQRNIDMMINLLNKNISNLPVKYFAKFLDSLLDKHTVLIPTYSNLIHQTILTNPIYYIKHCLLSYAKFIYSHREVDQKKVQLLLHTIRSNLNEFSHGVILSFIDFVHHSQIDQVGSTINHLDSLFIELKQHIYKGKIILTTKDMYDLLSLSKRMSLKIQDLLDYFSIQILSDLPTYSTQLIQDLVYIQSKLDPNRNLQVTSKMMEFSNIIHPKIFYSWRRTNESNYNFRSFIDQPARNYKPILEYDHGPSSTKVKQTMLPLHTYVTNFETADNIEKYYANLKFVE